ncbi:LysR family transcriptional regulator [Macrococcoides caseolyticum]|uniref:LysR family transcriptional regulator n=2 Tax=Macrococcoides TaxID=3076173 RepID=UPI001F3EA2F5|nr:LysR family transcriptional regulator [Macrococcus caseolyticus]MCE4957806.1 LysR family transcriptional regulator [Macrococcus caseolyticus]
MNTNDLELFMHMYETLSINKTAQLSDYAQSNVSMRLKSLENEFNNTLFIRSPQGLQPTEYGKHFYQYASLVINETKKIKSLNLKSEIIISEILFNYLVLYEKLFSLNEYNFNIKSTSEIVLIKQLDSTIITFNKLQLKGTKISKNYINAAFLRGHSQNYDLSYLINSDLKCPFRQFTLEQIDDQIIQEINSLESIIQLVRDNKGIALLPIYFTEIYPLELASDTIVEIPYYIYS